MTEHFNPFWKNPYKWLYSRIGGRPWTYIIRDFYHKYEVPNLLIVLAIGAVIGHYIGWTLFLIALAILLCGVIVGHLFWGTGYVPNQTDIANGGISFRKVSK
jgi:hypothetical protein